MSVDPLVRRAPLRLRADPSRVITRLFLPGHYYRPVDEEGRTTGVLDHLLALGDDEVTAMLAEVRQRFTGRHRDLTATLLLHAGCVDDHLGPGIDLSEERRLLLGAAFTMEFAVEAAAVCNPSVVALPDQSAAPAGALCFVMSVRQIGEGHRSSIGFRSGLLDGDGAVTLDQMAPFTTAGTIGTAFPDGPRAYTAHFPPDSALSERVLHPAASVESNGMEDARFVRFVDDDDTVTYYATYTAYDGHAIVQQLLATDDFVTFTVAPLHGPAAANKGLALFPRRIGGRYMALSRPDGATNAVARSDDIGRWSGVVALECPTAPWEVIQVGNCGAPIETEHGWLVLTHGVGPMRTYSIGALLLDLDDPSRVIGRLRRPLLTPQPDEQDGYVPNVVYSCGALLHRGLVLLPYGIGDANIGIATVALDDVLAAMDADDPLRAARPV